MVSVKHDAQFVADQATFTKVDYQGCVRAAETVFQAMAARKYSTATWSSHDLNPSRADLDNEALVDWIFLIDLLNFSFWSEADRTDSGDAQKSGRFAVDYKGKLYTGYWSLVAAVNRALDAGISITSPQLWTSPEFTAEFLQEKVFYSATTEPIPLLLQRHAVLKEAAAALSAYSSSAANVVKSANRSALALIDTLYAKFGSFNDTSTYKNRTVHLAKRAQIFVADLWAAFDGQSYGAFDDIDQITMFADYRVPQILHSLGCLDHSPQLIDDLKAQRYIEHGDNREIELRACSIWAVELMVQSIRSHHPTEAANNHINAILLDFYLWDTAKETQGSAQLPCHRTRSIFY